LFKHENAMTSFLIQQQQSLDSAMKSTSYLLHLINTWLILPRQQSELEWCWNRSLSFLSEPEWSSDFLEKAE